VGGFEFTHAIYSATMLDAGLVLGLFFNLEDGGEMFLQNIDCLPRNYIAYVPEDKTLQTLVKLQF
jgi:hypothetical protein